MSPLQKPLEALAYAIGSGYGVLLWVSLAMYFMLPLVWFWMGLNLRRIRKELSQLNETLAMPSRRL